VSVISLGGLNMSVIVKVEREKAEEDSPTTIGLFVFSALPRGGEKVVIQSGTRLQAYVVEQVEHLPVGSPEGSEHPEVMIYVSEHPEPA
jgi:hypothetical protein